MTTSERIWLDSAATTPLAPEVIDAMTPWLKSGIAANASSLHAEGRAARRVIENTRDSLASIFGVPAAQITFTSSATEANNLALAGSLTALNSTGSPHRVVTSPTEHPAVLKCLASLEERGVIETHWFAVDSDGCVDLDHARSLLAQRCALVSLMQINNETGTVQPGEEIARIARASNPEVIVHCDAVQAAPRMSQPGARADLIALSGHKIHAPTGVGMLVRRRAVALAPQILGGSQEMGLRAGTESPALIAGLGTALNLIDDNHTEIVAHLAHLAETILSVLTTAGVEFERIGHLDHSAVGFLSLRFPQIRAEDLVIASDLDGVALSAGSACSSGTPERSHVLTAMKIADPNIDHVVRIVPHRLQTEADVTEGAHRLAQAIKRAG